MKRFRIHRRDAEHAENTPILPLRSLCLCGAPLLLVLLPGLALATVPWSQEEITRNAQTAPPAGNPNVEVRMPNQIRSPKPDFGFGISDFVRHSDLGFGICVFANYLFEIKQTCDFIARYQYSDSSRADSFGGIIEAEHMPTTIETDNTQEAIWAWSRWYELTGRDDYRTNIRRAWFYVLRHPAYREGTGQYVWYSVWNCGLAFFAELKYRQVYGDSSFRAYADSCRDYCFSHPLNFTANTLHGNVTALAAGMMYGYATEEKMGQSRGKIRDSPQAGTVPDFSRSDPQLRDTALAYGQRVRAWVEQSPSRLRTGNWAMSGGTLLWGLCRSIWQDDTTTGKAWLAIYADSVPYFMPSGTWNCSWNIWDANGFRAAAEIVHEPRYLEYHRHLTDTLLGRDLDDDGGIPATWTDPQNQDQTWVSSYLDFMGMDFYAAPVYEHDVGVLGITGIDHGRAYLPGDTVQVDYLVANFGRQTASVSVEMVFGADTTLTTIPALGFLETETLSSGPRVLNAPGLVRISAHANAPNDTNPANDYAAESVLVHTPRAVVGYVRDTLSGQAIAAQLSFYLPEDSLPFRTVNTDSAGYFAVVGFDTTWRVTAAPEIPYPNRQWLITVSSDTALDLRMRTANLVLVNNDSMSRYEEYYTSTFDTLGLTYSIWKRRNGPVSAAALSRTQDRLLVWYTGSTVQGTLDSTDIVSLAHFLDSGGRLLLTGQNIGQELSGTEFYQQRLHARFIAPSVSFFYLYGDESDSLGIRFTQTQSAGPQGANNQTSRDEIAPDSLAHAFLLYDTATLAVAGIRYADPAGDTRLIYLGFGFEAVNRPPPHPTFMSRVEFFNECYAWLTGTSGLRSAECGMRSADCVVRSFPNPSPGWVWFRILGKIPQPSEVSLCIYDAAGRQLRRVSGMRSAERGILAWDGRDRQGRNLPPGVYFYCLAAGPSRFQGSVRLVH